MKAWEILRAKASGQVDLDEIGVTPEARRAFNQAMGEYILRDAHGLWLEPETGDGHCDPDQLVVTIGTRISALYDLFNNEKGSPIEGMMGAAMLWLDMDWAGMPSLDYLNGPKDHLEQFGSSDGLDYFITPQARIGVYRADFLVWFVMGKHYAGVIVECDGHDFHERTKEQAARDKKRDRELLAAGYPVMRFTGSEIFKDVTGCVEQLRGPLSDALERVSRAGGLFK